MRSSRSSHSTPSWLESTPEPKSDEKPEDPEDEPEPELEPEDEPPEEVPEDDVLDVETVEEPPLSPSVFFEKHLTPTMIAATSTAAAAIAIIIMRFLFFIQNTSLAAAKSGRTTVKCPKGRTRGIFR